MNKTLSKQLARLRGRTIMSVKLRPFGDGRGGKAYNPIITLDDGTAIEFVVQETDTGEYGFEPIVLTGDPGKTRPERG